MTWLVLYLWLAGSYPTMQLTLQRHPGRYRSAVIGSLLWPILVPFHLVTYRN